MTNVAQAPAGYVIVGGGKTALDAICWLLDRGTPADDITWIRPRDSWLLESRGSSSPARRVSWRRSKGSSSSSKRSRECDSVEEICERLEAHGVIVRVDPRWRRP